MIVGVILKKMGIQITPVYRVDILIEQHVNIIDIIHVDDINIFNYRLKDCFGNRKKDIQYFKKLLTKYYIKN